MRNRRAGFSLVEMAVATTVLVTLGAGLTLAVDRLRNYTAQGSAESSLELEAARAKAIINADLRRAGFYTDSAGADWPQLIDSITSPGSREVLYKQPALGVVGGEGEDKNRTLALVDENGNRVWDERVFRLRLGADGRLLRLIDDAQPMTVARHVEQVVIEDNTSSGYTVPLDALRVRLDFARLDENGRSLRLRTEWIVQLRNRD